MCVCENIYMRTKLLNYLYVNGYIKLAIALYFVFSVECFICALIFISKDLFFKSIGFIGLGIIFYLCALLLKKIDLKEKLKNEKTKKIEQEIIDLY